MNVQFIRTLKEEMEHLEKVAEGTTIAFRRLVEAMQTYPRYGLYRLNYPLYRPGF